MDRVKACVNQNMHGNVARLGFILECVRMLEFKHLCFKTSQQCCAACTMIVNHFLQRIFFFFYCLCYIQYVNRSCWSQLDACCEHFPPLRPTGPEACFIDHFLCVRERSYLSIRHWGITRWSFFLSWENWSFLDCPVWVMMVLRAWRQQRWRIWKDTIVHSLPCIRYSVHVSVNYMASITKGQECFFNPFFSSVSDLFWPLVRKDFTGRCYCKCRMCCSFPAPLLQTTMVLGYIVKGCIVFSVLCLLVFFSERYITYDEDELNWY